jgi:uncharacterized protein
MYRRKNVDVLVSRMIEANNPLIQFIVGPRQTGKTTMFVQALDEIDLESHVVNADDVINPTTDWISLEWQQARNKFESTNKRVVLVIDEVQKIKHWSSIVKGLWDHDRREGIDVKPILTGSSTLLLQRGLEESLMGRFEIIRSTHWSYAECRDAFGYTLDDYLFLGGYPATEMFRNDEVRWKNYVRDAIIEPTLSRDILELEEVRKPALMRNLLYLCATYSGQELSYNKMLGQLQEAGSAVTISSYLDAMQKANMIATLMKYNKKEVNRRASSPRLMVYDTSILNACSGKGRKEALSDPAYRGHLVESAVGARLLARSVEEYFEVYWWRESSEEVDFVLSNNDKLTAIEVKSGNTTGQSGMAAFLKKYPEAKRIVVGGSAAGACKVEDFLLDKVELF